MPNIFVPVVDQEQHPLMPTIPSRARRWIKGRKATGFWKGGFFCVRLGVEPSAREMQPIVVGVDPRSSKVGLVGAAEPNTTHIILAVWSVASTQEGESTT